MEKIIASCECAPNIALIKYWGKLNDELIIPLNGSISITLDSSVLSSRTCVVLTKTDRKTRAKVEISLDGTTQLLDMDQPAAKDGDLINKKRLNIMLNKLTANCSLPEADFYQIKIVSVNSFPTACGLASSASGFACLALCLAKAFGYNGDVSELARLGSGSACRSCFGGFVKWSTGSESAESIARPLFAQSHWPQMNILALILEDQRKLVSSTNGMKDTVLTSDLLKHRVELVEHQRLDQMENFIRQRDFENFGRLVMKDSNSFHAVCTDTSPPLFYLNDKSKHIINIVNKFNAHMGATRVAYSFDAGPNPFLFVLDDHLVDLVFVIYKLAFSKSTQDEDTFCQESIVQNKQLGDVNLKSLSAERRAQIDSFLQSAKINTQEVVVKKIIHSKVGRQPVVYENEDRFGLLGS